MNSNKSAPRLVGRQFATPLSQSEIDQVAGADGISGEDLLGAGGSTCTVRNDGD